MIEHRNILALDLGTLMGWAFYEGEEREPDDPAAWSWGHRDLGDGAPHGDRFRRAHAVIDDLLARLRPSWLVLEMPFSRGRAAAQLLLGYRAIALMLVCNVGVLEVTPQELKRAATGKGGADKGAVLASARARWGEKVRTEDEADALWALEFVRLNAEVEGS